MINYASMNKDYAWIQQIKQDIIDKVIMKNANKAVRDVILQYIDDVIPQNPKTPKPQNPIYMKFVKFLLIRVLKITNTWRKYFTYLY